MSSKSQLAGAGLVLVPSVLGHTGFGELLLGVQSVTLGTVSVLYSISAVVVPSAIAGFAVTSNVSATPMKLFVPVAIGQFASAGGCVVSKHAFLNIDPFRPVPVPPMAASPFFGKICDTAYGVPTT